MFHAAWSIVADVSGASCPPGSSFRKGTLPLRVISAWLGYFGDILQASAIFCCSSQELRQPARPILQGIRIWSVARALARRFIKRTGNCSAFSPLTKNSSLINCTLQDLDASWGICACKWHVHVLRTCTFSCTNT